MQHQQPMVSIIIIFLDPGAAFLDEAIASVWAQDFADWELLLVDDGSSDGSSTLAREAAAAAPERVHYLEHPGHANLGMSASRNLGVRAAAGRYLAFLDADDAFLPDRLAPHIDILESHPDIAMTFSRHQLWFSWQKVSARVDVVPESGFTPGRVLAPPSVLLALLETSGRGSPGICTLTVRRAAALAVGGFEAAFRGCYEDQVFIAKMLSRFPVWVLDRVDCRYRQHEASCTAVAARTGEVVAGRPNDLRERYFRWLVEYLEDNGLMRPDLRRILARKLLPYDHRRLYGLTVLPILAARNWLVGRKRRLTRADRFSDSTTG